MKRNAEDFQQQYPAAAVKNNLSVDDSLNSADKNEAIAL